MPRIKGIPGPHRFFFTSFDCNEPAYVHVERERSTASSGWSRSNSLGATASALEN